MSYWGLKKKSRTKNPILVLYLRNDSGISSGLINIHTQKNWYSFWPYVSPHFCPLKLPCMGGISICNCGLYMSSQSFHWFLDSRQKMGKFMAESFVKYHLHVYKSNPEWFWQYVPSKCVLRAKNFKKSNLQTKSGIKCINTAHTGRP